MDRRKSLQQFVERAKRSLNIEKSLPRLQYGLLLAVVVYTAILFISRLFVFPYYSNVALWSSIGVVLVTIGYIWWRRVKYQEALTRLDSFYPHNELVTALSLKDESNPLVNAILQNAQKASEDSFTNFKQRKKRLLKPKALIAILFMFLITGVLYIFPSPTQQEAVAIEKENEVIDELKEEVAELEKKTANEEMKQQLKELQNKLKEVDQVEEALREVVKKQKELKLQEQKLQDKKDLVGKGQGAEGLTAEEEERLKGLLELQSALAESAGATQTALSKLGKSISFDLQNAIAQESSSNSSSESNGDKSQGDNDNQSGSSGQQSNGQSSQGNGNNDGGSNGSDGQGTNGSQGQGNGSGQGNGQGSGSGQGQGNGGGSGGQGSGSGGNGAGLGQGNRNLLSIPERVGENGEVVVDGGPLGEGTPIGEQEGPVPVTKGTIRPYEEVIGQYKDRYMESSERMQLPKDLQSIVQSYFSSIESE
ncbi:hypothetical protein [Ureibacillus acetophenoni]|uniref:Uncharacterized protein n=1 Tax=Ureibacillus acetophenoni TaxID=614649 RepID=A0A285USZ0_9BACL|nr:hypothetical protein [Ureibacillus acetophenoni]SOC44929.1 hypothetical protein SAMN05877842_12511 [Ureibacillus acetophenoni]